jgi:hypothetical protein
MGKKKKSFSRSKASNKNCVKFKTKYNKTLQYKDGSFFEVEAIRARKGDDSNPIYMVKWKFWPEDTNTWEPAKNLKNVRHLVEEFERTKNNKKDLSFLNPFFEDTGELSLESEPEACLDADVPQKILKIKKEDDGEVKLKIDWLVRANTGFKPDNSWVCREEFKKKTSNLLMLIEYYENHFRFCV